MLRKVELGIIVRESKDVLVLVNIKGVAFIYCALKMQPVNLFIL